MKDYPQNVMLGFIGIITLAMSVTFALGVSTITYGLVGGYIGLILSIITFFVVHVVVLMAFASLGSTNHYHE